MTLRLHWSPDSANLPVRIALEMFGLDYEAMRVDRAAGEHRSDAFRRLNPQGLIPVLEDDALVLFETGAILWHLAEKVGRLGPSGPEMNDERARSIALPWLFYLSNTVHADLRIAFNLRRYIDADAGAEQLLQGMTHRVKRHFDLVEVQFADRIFGEVTTLPEIYFVALVRWSQLYPVQHPVIADLKNWPMIEEMCRRIEAHPAARRAFEAEAIPLERAITSPRVPDLPLSDVTAV